MTSPTFWLAKSTHALYGDDVTYLLIGEVHALYGMHAVVGVLHAVVVGAILRIVAEEIFALVRPELVRWIQDGNFLQKNTRRELGDGAIKNAAELKPKSRTYL